MDAARDLLSDVPSVVVEYERQVGPAYRGEAFAPRSRSNPVLIETDHLRGSYRVEFTVIGDAAPRLLPRRPLSFNVSLLLALLRKKLAEQDATGGETRLVMSRDEIAELVRVFRPENSNEARMTDRLDADLNRIVELGFLRRMKAQDGARSREFEVQRFLKAFVDAQWLTEFDSRLAAYRSELERSSP